MSVACISRAWRFYPLNQGNLSCQARKRITICQFFKAIPAGAKYDKDEVFNQ
jgi:hypothetical protein